MDNWLIWVGIATLGGLVVFSALNLALRIPSRARIAEQFEKKGRADVLEAFVSARPQYIMATAILRSAAMLGLVLVAIFMAAAPAADRTLDTILAGAVTLALVLVFGVAIPNAWAKYTGEWLVVRVLPLLAAIRGLCLPLIVALELFDPVVRRLAGVPVRDARSYADELEQQILEMVSEGERHGAVDEEEKEMIESVIELAETRVEEIMTPRTEIVALPKEADLETVLTTIREKGHSRVPVFDGTIDTILGVLYAKDMLLREEGAAFELTALMRRMLFIPESKLVRELLREFQAQKVHIAAVLDEYGGTAGLVSIEDILEELVGEITDEYDAAATVGLKRIDERTVEVDARMRIDDLNDQLDVDLPEDGDYETIGGFVFSRLGKIPKVGEQCGYENVSIQVVAAESRRITRLRLHVTPVAEHEQAQK